MGSGPRETGISAITDKIVVIRHAGDRDRVLVEHYLDVLGRPSEVDAENIVVATENERIIGFGIMKQEKGSGCVSLFEDSRRKGIGVSILRHLVSTSPVERVYAAHRATYFSGSRPAATKMQGGVHRRNAGGRCTAPLLERVFPKERSPRAASR